MTNDGILFCLRLCVCVEEPIDVIGGSSGSDVSSEDSLDEPLVPYTSKMVLVDTLWLPIGRVPAYTVPHTQRPADSVGL